MLLSRYCQTFSHKFDSDIWATAFISLGIKREFVDKGKKYCYTYLLLFSLQVFWVIATLFSDLYGIATAFTNDRKNHFEDFCTSDAIINKCGHTAWNQPNSTKSWSSGKLIHTLRNLKKWTCKKLILPNNS